MHFRRPPVPSTAKLVADAPLESLQTGTRAVVEIVGYPDGQMRLVTSRIEGTPGSRRIVQVCYLMFVDADEAKDALDSLVDRVATESA
jgi:2-methylisocitrate lyase-like PEP mutase family enzyme